MAWDLWGSSYDQVACDGTYSEHPEWQCDFYFGCEPDVIDEDALNEEYCVQVLRILITKADTEIEELEKDLLSLQNELAWAEHENWLEICCSALTERINWLDVAISNLKKDHADEMETRLLLHSKPAETLHEIVKALQRDHCQATNGQGLIRDRTFKMIIEMEEIDESINPESPPKENALLIITSELKDKLLDANISNPIVNVTEYALGKESSNTDSNIVIKEEGKELAGTSENSRSSELLLKLQEKRPDEAEMIEELLAKALVRSPGLGDISCSPCHSDGMQLSGTSVGVTGNEGARKSQLIATDTGQMLNLLSSKGNGNIPREAKREVAIVKEKHVSSDALRLATGIKGRKKCLDSRFGTSNKRKCRNSDLEKKLCDFAPKTTRRTCKKESKVAPAEDLDPMNCPLQVVYPQDLCPADTELCSFKGGNGKNSRQMMNIRNTSLVHAESSALISLFEMQAESALYPGLQLTDEEKPLAQGLKSKTAANIIKSNMSFSSKLKTRGKRKSELETYSAGEPHDSPTEIITNTCLIVSSKRQRKSTSITDDASSNESMNSKMTKRAVQPGQCEADVCAIVPYDREFSELQKKRRVSKLPITMEINSNVNLDIPNSDRVSTDDRIQVDLQISKLYSLVGTHTETSDSLPITLKKFTLPNLRAIAKEHNVKKYYKLKKEALVEQLVERFSNC